MNKLKKNLSTENILLSKIEQKLPTDDERYSVYHASFRDFLHRKDILEKTGLTIPKIHSQIAEDQLKKWNNRRRHE